MSPHVASFLFDSEGPVNTGTGNQFNAPVYIFDQSRERLVRMGELRAVAYEHMRWLYPRFVEPRNYGQAQELLEDNGSVLLTGAPGSGRRAAAQMLLHDPSDMSGLIRELPDTSNSSGRPVLDSDAVDAGERLLLDLSISDESDKDNGTLLRQLGAYRAVVHERGARLVVVLPQSRTYHLDAELGPPPVEIGRPNGTEVFQQHLRGDGIRVGREQLGIDDLPTLLGSAPMRDIAELARLVQDARKLEPVQAFSHWLGGALEALTQWSDKVAEQMKELASGQQRALLITTAMLSEAPADAVCGATSELLKTFKQPEDELPLLERKGFREQLAEIGAKANGAGRVSFTRLAYDRAVRTHFWTDYPDLREGFRDWVGTAISQSPLTSEDRDRMIISFAEQALRTDRPGDLRHLAEHWAKRTDPRWPSKLLPQAVRALERGLSHERYSFFFRRQLYTWSTAYNLSSDLAQVVVLVCSEVIAPTHPKQAVVRLHHIFRRRSDAAGEAAYDALLDLVDRDPRLCSYLLARVTRDRATHDPREVVPDTALFLELAGPDRLTAASLQMPPLIEDVTVRAQLVSGWRTVLAAPSSLRCAAQVRVWLAACADDRFCDRLLDVLVNSCDGRYDVLSRLYVIARDWAYAPDGRRGERIRITDRLNHKIDAAQGIDFYL
ncbi:MAG: hypothetical protein ACRDYX_15310 [Egibacteraceae bacterium]